MGPCKGSLRTCSCSQHPVMNLDFHVFPPSSGNVFAKEAAAVNPLQVRGAQGAGCPGAGSCLAVSSGSCVGGTVPPPPWPSLWQAPPCTAFLAGCVGQRVRACRQTQPQHKYNSGCKGWLRGRVSNRGEDSSVIIYAAQRKELLGSCWQAGGGTEISQAS